MKVELKPTIIDALPAAPHGKRAYAWDLLVPGFCVRVSDKGAKSFCLSVKLPGKTNTQILTIGAVGQFTLAEARDVARDWKIAVNKGANPKADAKAADQAVAKQAEDTVKNSFRARAAEWQGIALSGLRARTRTDIAATMNNKLIPVWGDRAVDTLGTKEIADQIKVLATTLGAGAARTALSHLKTFYTWLANDGTVPFSPCAAISGQRLLGKAGIRKRVLNDAELAQVWFATETLEQGLRQIYQLLILTGCRRNEITHASWSEIDLQEKVWVIPAERMKAGRVHVLPLTPMMIAVINSIPRNGSALVFPNGNGAAWRLGEREKTKIARACGFSDWVNHDLRRTMRTRLSSKLLGISKDIAERMIAHSQGVLDDIYNQFAYIDEKREGFQAWNDEVARIVGRHDANVVRLAA
jgi:integrase